MSHLTRRSLMKRSALGAAALSVPWTARSWANVVGANEDVRMAVIGFNGRGKNHTDSWKKMKGVRLVALCDADEAVLKRENDRLTRTTAAPSTRPTTGPSTRPTENAQAERPLQLDLYTDMRKVFDNKDIDGVSVATPNHWHALAAIWACQAGKDVYLEKPVSHNVWEGRKIVEAARKYDRIVQTGTQNRSNTAYRDAIAWAQEGNLGKIKVVRGLCYKRRPSIGRTQGEQSVPKTVDYDLWLGPAPKEAPHRKQFHYDWHWFWAYGGGDLANQGIHEMDKARWASGKDHLAPQVVSIGGRFGYEDDGQTPNTQFAVHDYGDLLLIFEVRGLPHKTGAGNNMDKYRGQGVGDIIECEGGYVSIGEAGGATATAFDNDNKQVKRFTGRAEDHFANFIKAVRSHKREDLHADILEGHLSSALCHTSNISYRLGQQAAAGEIYDTVRADKGAYETLQRFAEHLEMNDVSLAASHATLGPVLKMDPKTERFIDNDDANKMLTREYREPFVVPENV